MLHVTCHMSRVRSNTAHVMCPLLHFFLIVFLFVQSGEAYQWRLFYQWDLPRLVYKERQIDTLAFIDKQTHTGTWRLYDYMTAQRHFNETL